MTTRQLERGAVLRAAVAALAAVLVLLAAYLASSVLLDGGDGEAWEPPVGMEATESFPDVDWGVLMAQNPDTVGWVTVPGTTVNYPVVKAPESDPQKYLRHSFEGKRSGIGAVYLDASCTDGLDSKACYVFAHNIAHGEPMFRPVADYVEQGFAEGHRTILLQTPSWKKRLEVVAVDEVPGHERSKVTTFESDEDYRSFHQDRVTSSEIVLDGAEDGSWDDRLFAFVTCVDDTSRNDRVIVYAHEA